MEGGHTALQVASHEGHCDVMKLLLDRGAHRDAMVGDRCSVYMLLNVS